MAASSSVKEALQREYSALIEGYRSLQTELQKVHNARAQWNAQHAENESVKEELDRLDDEANVFKLVGPALIKQDLVEARSNVEKRLEYIKSEVDRLDNQIKSVEGKLRDKEKEIAKFQQKASVATQGK